MVEDPSWPAGKVRRWLASLAASGLMGSLGAWAENPPLPVVLACDSDQGIAVISHRGVEGALLRGETDLSGDWRLAQVASDSAVFANIRSQTEWVRVFVEGSGRPPVRFSDRVPPAPPAMAVDIQRMRAKGAPPEAP